MKFATVTRSLALGVRPTAGLKRICSHEGQCANQPSCDGTTLKPGDYKVAWEGSGSNVEVSIMQSRSVPAKTSAHQVELAAPASNDAIVIVKNDNGTSSLTGLRFEEKKFSLELGESTDGLQAGSSR
jgi:hypothetical protein